MKLHAKFTLGAFAIIGLLATAPASHAFGMSGFGAKLGVTDPSDLGATLTLGAHLEFEQPGTQVHLLPSLMYWSSDDVTDVSPNFDVYYHFQSEGMVTPYVGGGLGMHFFNNSRTDRSKSDLGANLMGGLRFPAAASHYFLEGRYTVADISQFAVLGGITLHR